MSELPENQAPTTFAMLLGRELRRYRKAAGLSLTQLGEKTHYTAAHIGFVEQALRSCPNTLAEVADTELDARGALLNLWKATDKEARPGESQPFVRAEAEAHAISEYQPAVISRLLQTEEYATEVIRALRPEATEEEIKRDVNDRIKHQAILDRVTPPRYWLILGEAALRTVIGSPALMYDQLTAILKAAAHPNITIQVLPFSAGAHAALDGPLTLLDSTHKTAHCPGHATGRTITAPEEIDQRTHTFRLLQSTALSIRESRALTQDITNGYGP